MAKINGTWRLKDVPTAPSDAIYEKVNFSFSLNGADIIGILGCDAHINCSLMELIPQGSYPLDVYYRCDTSSIDLSDLGVTLPHTFLMYGQVDAVSRLTYEYGEGIQTITFTEEQEVSDDFYDWFVENASPMTKTLSGTWRFNDVLTQSFVESGNEGEITQSINYDVSNEGQTQACDKITVYVDSDTTITLAMHTNGDDGMPVYYGDEGWLYGDVFKTITFTGEQEVSAEFYAWLTANAVESEPVLPEEPDEPEKTLSGTWRLNDVLTLPAVGQLVSFTSHLEVADRGWDFDIICSAMVSGGDSGVYYRVTSTSDDAPEDAFAGFPIEIPVYSESGWSTSSYGSGIKTITFTGEQEVSDEFYAWFTANASETDGGDDGGGDDDDDGTDTPTDPNPPVDPTPPDEPDNPDYPNNPTADTIIAKIKSLISKANKTTGKADDDLTDGVNSLIEGYGVGEGLKLQEKKVYENGLVTPGEGYNGLRSVDVNVPTEIPDGYVKPEGIKEINGNGDYDVTEYEGVKVSVPTSMPDGYLKPVGTKSITENGTHDVTEFAAVEVDVPIPNGYVKPDGTKQISANGEYDVAEFAKVYVAVEGGGGDGEIIPIYDDRVEVI